MAVDDDTWADLEEQTPCHPDAQELVEMRDELERVAVQSESRILAKYYRAVRRLLAHGAILREAQAQYREDDRSDEIDLHLAAMHAHDEDASAGSFSEDEVVVGLIESTITNEAPAGAESILETLRRAGDENGGDP